MLGPRTSILDPHDPCDHHLRYVLVATAATSTRIERPGATFIHVHVLHAYMCARIHAQNNVFVQRYIPSCAYMADMGAGRQSLPRLRCACRDARMQSVWCSVDVALCGCESSSHDEAGGAIDHDVGLIARPCPARENLLNALGGRNIVLEELRAASSPSDFSSRPAQRMGGGSGAVVGTGAVVASASRLTSQ